MIIQSWVADLPLRHQGTLLAAVRGCDGHPKENSAKPIVRTLRFAFMTPFDAREVDLPSAFFSSAFTHGDLRGFLTDWDHYPMHFVQHLMHGCEVIGYKHPDQRLRSMFLDAYLGMVRKLHLTAETEFEMDARLMEDRIALHGDAVGLVP